MKESKKSYFTNYFQNNLNDLKSTWKGIKNLISLKELPNVAPSNVFDNGRSLTELQEIANAFNNILSLNPSKAIGPNKIPTKILRLLINDVSSQLTFPFPAEFSH